MKCGSTARPVGPGGSGRSCKGPHLHGCLQGGQRKYMHRAGPGLADRWASKTGRHRCICRSVCLPAGRHPDMHMHGSRLVFEAHRPASPETVRCIYLGCPQGAGAPLLRAALPEWASGLGSGHTSSGGTILCCTQWPWDTSSPPEAPRPPRARCLWQDLWVAGNLLFRMETPGGLGKAYGKPYVVVP